MRKIFLDCGTNLGQGLQKIQNNLDEDFEVYCFEANKLTYDKFLNKLNNNTFLKKSFKKFEVFNKAVWTDTGFKKLTMEYCPHEVGWVGGASNILEDNFLKPHYIDDQYIKDGGFSETIDLMQFIEDNFSKNDYIICKMDIEGAEYPILEKMIEKNNLNYIKILYVEWHNRMLVNKYDENYIKQKINEANIILHEWY
jgi:FkbM family methyltransferase